MQGQFDYLIIGAGSAGCALAYRLSENPQNKILIIEAGGTDIGPFIQMPAALSYPMNMSLYDWGYKSQPEPNLAGRQMMTPRGKLWGGSSSINGMVYVRGHAEDFNNWEKAGAKNWSYADVAPYFRRLEDVAGDDDNIRGDNGPVHVTRGKRINPLYDAFIEAGTQAGYEWTKDYNGIKQEGFGAFDMTVWRGRRWSSANAYLRPTLKRPNVKMMDHTIIEKISLNKRRATSVRGHRRGKKISIECPGKIIIASSAINSPWLLLNSGIGPADDLNALGLDVQIDLPGVGQNLQDHLEVYMQYECLQPITLYSHLNLFGKFRIGLRWLLCRDGLGASNHFESGAFIRSHAGISYPNIQFHFLPLAIKYDGRSALKGHGFQIHAGPTRPRSRGHVKLDRQDPTNPPIITYNYLSDPEDLEEFRAAIRHTREVVSQPALAPYRGREVQPGPDIINDEAIDRFIAAEAESAYHPCGTCRMGDPADPLSVVDPSGLVVGTENLYVADSSIFPLITYGNTNAPSMMVGEKLADHIMGKKPLTPMQRKPWFHPHWQTQQR